MAEQSPVKRRVPGSSPGGRASNPSSSIWIERAATNREVTGSNPVRGTGVIACYGLLPMFCPYGLAWFRTSPSHGEGHGFKSR